MRRSATIRTLVFLLAAIPAAGALHARRAAAQDNPPLRFTLRTIENDAGVRVILEFTRKPIYEVRRDPRRIYITLKEEGVEPPFKKKDYGGTVLDRIKFAEGLRTSEVVFFTGDEFGNFASFEMGEPFRLVLDLHRRQAPPMAVGVPGPGAPAPGGAAGTAPGAAPPPAPKAEAPPPPAAPEVPEKPRAAFVVVIDPGHGGDDTGARGPTGLMEKDITLDVARRLRARIRQEIDAEVILTREDDRPISLDERTAIANHHRADLFVSIHANASRRSDAQGAETYFLSYQATDDDARAVAAIENNTLGLEEGVQGNSSLEMLLWDLAQSAFLKESSGLAEMVQDRLNDALGIANRGIKQAPFRVLMGATMPAVLIEVAFISNSDEERRLKDPAFKDRLSGAIFESVRRFHDRYVRNGPR